MGSGFEQKGIILLSGGLDSAVTLALASAQGFKLHAIFFDYGQPAAQKEEYFANLVSTRYGAEAFHSFKLCQGIVGSPTKGNFEYPLRNLFLLSAASAIAASRNRPHVFVGIISAEGPESADCVYSDCSEEFLDAAAVTMEAGWPDLRLHAPLCRVTKTGVFGMAAALGVDRTHTFSCLTPDKAGDPCKQCVSCLERQTAQEEHESP
jgi:7-cyano-7-deazaguanine synthase